MTALILNANGEPTWRYRIEPFRTALESAGIPSEVLDKRCGWSDSYSRKLLGYTYRTSRGRRYYQQTLTYDNAVKLATALDLDFTEIGV